MRRTTCNRLSTATYLHGVYRSGIRLCGSDTAQNEIITVSRITSHARSSTLVATRVLRYLFLGRAKTAFYFDKRFERAFRYEKET